MGSFELGIKNFLEPGYNLILDNPVCHGYTRFATATHVFPPLAVEAQMQGVSQSVGMGVDVVKFFIALLLSYPLGLLSRQLPLGTARHLAHFLGGVMLAQFCFGPGWAHLFASSMVTYVLIRFGGKKASDLNFYLQLGYMIVCHLNRLINHFGEFILDFTGPQMVATIKLTSFGYNYTDGERGRTPEQRDKALKQLDAEMKQIKEALDKDPNDKDAKNKRRTVSVKLARTKLCVDEMPSLLEYLGFIYCFSGYAAGPALEITQYLDATNDTEFARSVPSGVLPGLKNFAVGILCVGLHLGIGGMFPLVPDPAKGLKQTKGIFSAEFLTWSLAYQFAYIMVGTVAVRCRYYFAWKCGEGAYNMAGFGYEGKDNWGGCNNMDIIAFETAQNVQQTSKSWNKKTQHWLETYTYKRVQGSRTMQQVLTYSVSAFWHGLEAGFYFFFLTCPFLDAAREKMNQKVRPYFMEADGKTPKATKPLYDFLGWVANQSLTNTIVLPFLVMQMACAIEIIKRLHFIPYLVILTSLVVLTLLPDPTKAKKA